ncbi:iron uptake system protein EfeO [Paenibacillus sp. GCM10012307]|uniref:EfeM/EfeO family lipoprotein n=1 Tax=Paenibacillus roseus TaxID=2798579 RepID=A0A934MQA4_9BACL|nr:iron uptake system protein EfeO [Paenibacillus roseus]MBJ6361673.1 EfeM/EfeO family lipoprotein [Paenibacillus roseus]
MKARFMATTSAAVLAISLLASGCGSAGDTKKDNKPAQAATNANAVQINNETADDYKAIIDEYRKYVIAECDLFVTETEAFVQAIKAGEIDKAKAIYAPARMHYERIEPIAEALGDFDPNIDARENDVEAAEWRGYHKLEKALWEQGSTEGMEETADRLLEDVKLLRAKVETVDIEVSMLATGAVELLNEVSATKVTGEEERYSRTDLYDFVANVEGAEKIYELLKSKLKDQDAELTGEIEQRFKEINEALASHKSGEGYVSYDDLKGEDTRKLSQALDALAEPLSRMGAVLGV